MIKIRFLGILLGLAIAPLHAQVKGIVKDTSGEPIVAANVFWAKTTQGTTTDSEGRFSIAKPSSARYLVASFIGYENDTVLVKKEIGRAHV